MKNLLKWVNRQKFLRFFFQYLNVYLFLLFVIGSKNESTSRIMYFELNEKIERMSKFVHFVLMRVSYLGAILPPLLTTLSNYFILNLGNESYQLQPMLCVKINDLSWTYAFNSLNFRFLPFYRLPLNQRTVYGYVIYTLISTAGSYCTIFCTVLSVSFLIGTSWLFIAFAKDMSNDFQTINIVAKLKKTRGKVKIHFYHIVQNYSNVKQLSVPSP